MATTSQNPRGLLGLGADADPVEVEAQYEELQGFLDLRKVPRALRPWALRQRVLVDEAYAAIGEGDDGGDALVGATRVEADDGALVEREDVTEDECGEARTDGDGRDAHSPSGSESGPGLLGASQPRAATSTFEIVTEDRWTSQSARPSPPPRRPDPPTNGHRSARSATRTPFERSPVPGHSGTRVNAPDWRPPHSRGLPIPTTPWRRVLLGLLLGALLLGGLFVATRGWPSIGVASAQSSAPPASQQAQVDERRAAELKGIVASDPANKDALFELGEMYIQAGRWQDSLDWFTKLLALDPDNLHARTDVGTDAFNLGRYDEARTAWEEVARRSPDDPQIHYNLGFLYASPHGKAADVEAAKREWQKVIELAPNTELAREAQASLDVLAKQ